MKEAMSIGIKAGGFPRGPSLAAKGIGMSRSFGERSFRSLGRAKSPGVSIDRSLSRVLNSIGKETPFQIGSNRISSQPRNPFNRPQFAEYKARTPQEDRVFRGNVKSREWNIIRPQIAKPEARRISSFQKDTAFRLGRPKETMRRPVREVPKVVEVGREKRGIIFPRNVIKTKEFKPPIDFTTYQKGRETRFPKPIDFTSFRENRRREVTKNTLADVALSNAKARRERIKTEMLASFTKFATKERSVPTHHSAVVIPINPDVAREQLRNLSQNQKHELNYDLLQAVRLYQSAKRVGSVGVSPLEIAIKAFEKAAATRGISKPVAQAYIQEQVHPREERDTNTEEEKATEIKTKQAAELLVKKKTEEEEDEKKKEKKEIKVDVYVAQEDKKAQEARLILVQAAVDAVFEEKAQEVVEGQVVTGKEIVTRWIDGKRAPQQNSKLLTQVGLPKTAADGSLIKARVDIAKITARSKETAMKLIKDQLVKHMPVIIEKVEQARKATSEDIAKVLEGRFFIQWFADLAKPTQKAS